MEITKHNTFIVNRKYKSPQIYKTHSRDVKPGTFDAVFVSPDRKMCASTGSVLLDRAAIRDAFKISPNVCVQLPPAEDTNLHTLGIRDAVVEFVAVNSTLPTFAFAWTGSLIPTKGNIFDYKNES